MIVRMRQAVINRERKAQLQVKKDQEKKTKAKKSQEEKRLNTGRPANKEPQNQVLIQEPRTSNAKKSASPDKN